MLTDAQILKLQKAALIIVIVAGLGILTTLLIKKYSTPRALRYMPDGMHMCVGKKGDTVYSKQPCRDDETTVQKPSDKEK